MKIQNNFGFNNIILRSLGSVQNPTVSSDQNGGSSGTSEIDAYKTKVTTAKNEAENSKTSTENEINSLKCNAPSQPYRNDERFWSDGKFDQQAFDSAEREYNDYQTKLAQLEKELDDIKNEIEKYDEILTQLGQLEGRVLIT